MLGFLWWLYVKQGKHCGHRAVWGCKTEPFGKILLSSVVLHMYLLVWWYQTAWAETQMLWYSHNNNICMVHHGMIRPVLQVLTKGRLVTVGQHNHHVDIKCSL